MKTTKFDKLPEQIEYEKALKIIRDAAIKVRLRQQFGLDPYKISQQHFDQFKRLFEDLDKSEQTLNTKINALRAEMQQENQKIYAELNTLANSIASKQIPAVPPPPPIPEDEPKSESESPGSEPKTEADNNG